MMGGVIDRVRTKPQLVAALLVFLSLFIVFRPRDTTTLPTTQTSAKIHGALTAKEKSLFERKYPVYELSESNVAGVQNVLTPEQLEQKKVDMGISTDMLEGKADEEEQQPEGDSIFVDQLEYEAAPDIKVLAESKKIQYRLIVLEHERYYRKYKSKLYVPRLKKTAKLSLEEFTEKFLFTSQPVIIPFEAMRHLNFTTRSYTLPELLKMYPNHKPKIYKYGSVAGKELDLGPAIATLAADKDLVKTGKGRNFPRNMKVNPSSISKLDIQYPPYVLPGTSIMAPSVWFGAKTSSTKTHSDCCDNFAAMISGTKRWTVAPPSEARLLKPKCNGGLCWVKSLEHADEHAATAQAKKLRDQTQLITFDLHPGEMLFLPCGWFHHVENLGPTIMVNFWTKGKPAFMQYVNGELAPTKG